jgi:hypothetical protein
VICPNCQQRGAVGAEAKTIGVLPVMCFECRCGATWAAELRVIRGSIGVKKGVIGGTSNTPNPPIFDPQITPKSPPNHELGGFSLSDSGLLPIFSADSDPERARVSATPRVRGKSKAYSPAFEECWRKYGRKEEKAEAFKHWGDAVRQLGGNESALRDSILAALEWQASIWGAESWKFAPYFERYLKRRRWEDERPTDMPTVARPVRKSWQEEQSDRAIAEAMAITSGGRGR